MSDRMQKFSIELDCPPGFPRPDDLLPDVIEGTGIEITDLENVGRLFGNWTWILKEDADKDASFTAAKPTFKTRIENLYHTGAIRYGSW